MKKGMTFVMTFSLACLLCCLSVPAFALDTEAGVGSISPHAEGVCAPNDLIISEDVESEAEEPEEDPVEDEPAEEPEEEPIWDDNLTVEEKVQVNRDPDSEVWYHIEDEDCPGHEWENCDDGEEAYRFCLNCGRTEMLEREGPEEVPEDEPEIDGSEEDDLEWLEEEEVE